MVRREDLYITTKLWTTYADRAAENLDKSLAALGLDYIDLYLVVSKGALRRGARSCGGVSSGLGRVRLNLCVPG